MSKRMTYAENLLKWRVGCFNIDACRVGNETIKTSNENRKPNTDLFEYGGKCGEDTYHNGRFPANLILSHNSDCEYLGVTEEEVSTHSNGKGNTGDGGIYNKYENQQGGNERQTVVPKYSCSPDCPCRLMDEQAPETGNGWKRNYDEYNGKVLGGDGMFAGGLYQKGNTHCDGGKSGASRFFLQISESEPNE